AAIVMRQEHPIADFATLVETSDHREVEDVALNVRVHRFDVEILAATARAHLPVFFGVLPDVRSPRTRRVHLRGNRHTPIAKGSVCGKGTRKRGQCDRTHDHCFYTYAFHGFLVLPCPSTRV